MSNHSSIDEAEYSCMIASEAPVYSEADYDAILEMLEIAHTALRGAFVGGQDPSVPREWKIDGLVYRRVDKLLKDTKEKLLTRFRASKFFAGQRMRDNEIKREKANLAPQWSSITPDQAVKFKQQGFDVRMTTKNGKVDYQYTTLKQTGNKPKTSLG